MKLHLVSDIHLEFGDLILPGGELLIIAGDMAEIRNFWRNDSAGVRKMAKNLHRFMNEEIPKYKDIIFVSGNHEYYGRSIEETEILLRFFGEKMHILQGESIEIGGYLFFGTTLWTDMNKENPLTLMAARSGMNDYKCISHFSPQISVDIHKEQLNKLVNFLNSHIGKDNLIVITHHAPSFQSVDEFYKNEFHMNGAFASDLSEIIYAHPEIKYWFHGHMHAPKNYMINKTNVICHPRGYFGYEKIANYYEPKEIIL